MKIRFKEILFFLFILLFSFFEIALLNPIGWFFFLGAIVILPFLEKTFRIDMILICISFFFLGITPISTNVNIISMLSMATPIALAILIPYYVSHKFFKIKKIEFPYKHHRHWKRFELWYLVIGIILAYILLPLYWATGPAHNWTVEITASHLIRLFVGINGLVILEEILFFGVMLERFNRWISFHWANLLVASLFTTFLYQLGFTGFWGPFLIFPFTLAQGYALRYTGSLKYIIVVHVILDLILFMSLINAHHPEILQIFLTS